MADILPNLRHLRCFLEVAQAGGIGAAAELVHLSQPAVTQAIIGLEARFGTALFNRRPEGMFLTGQGRVLQRRMVRVFSLLSEGAREASRVAARHGARPESGFQSHLTASHLRALVALSRAGSFSQAARDCGISQPSIHRAARELERTAGMAFFTATGQGINLSRAGLILAKAVQLAQSEFQQGCAELSALAGHDSSHIRVGSLPLSRSAILPRAMHELIGAGGAIQVHNIDGPYGELLRALRFGELDFLIGALRTPPPGDDVVQEPLFDDQLALVVGPGHALAGRRDLTLDAVTAYPWVAPPKTTPAGDYLFRRLGIGAMQVTPVRVVSSSLVLVRGLLARGDYVSIMSLNQIALELSLGQIVPLDLPLPGSSRAIGLTMRAGWRPTPTQARFLQMIRAAAQAESGAVNSQIE